MNRWYQKFLTDGGYEIPNILPADTARTDKALEDSPARRELEELMRRLEAAGISIAIDRSTGSALLVFTLSDADAVRHVADIYQPFKVSLSDDQREQLIADLNYWDDLKARRKAMEKGN
jgi:hypothetical protein